MAYEIKELKHLSSGKVREIYNFEEDKLLIITTDRISAFDVIMEDEIIGKGKVLNQLSNFWFNKFANIIENHLISTKPHEDFESLKKYKDILEDRAIVVKKCKPLPIEAIVRGYLAGSGLKEYQKQGTVCGIKLPEGLKNSSKLPEPIFTPSSKAEVGEHDENISFEEMKKLIGKELAEKVKNISLEIFKQASEYALTKGIIIPDTKFEFGMLGDKLILIDEILTPDSSRFWSLEDYKEGVSQKSLDKQYLRDYLQDLVDNGKWNKEAPAPKLSKEVLDVTIAKYEKIRDILKG